jgi:hypothetical protein
MGIGEAFIALGEDPNAYMIREPLYSLILTLAGFLGLVGLVLLIRGIKK